MPRSESPSPQRCAAAILESLPALMHKLRQIMRDSRGGLTIPQFRVLAFLDRHPGSGLAAVADVIGIGKATASPMIGVLERNGLVMRAPAADRRTIALRVSDSGRALLGEARSTARARMAERLAGLGPRSLAGLEQAFQALDRCFADAHPAAPTEA